MQRTERTGAVGFLALRMVQQPLGLVRPVSGKERGPFLLRELNGDVRRQFGLHIEEQIVQRLLGHGGIGIDFPEHGLEFRELRRGRFGTGRLFAHPAGSRAAEIDQLAEVLSADGHDAAHLTHGRLLAQQAQNFPILLDGNGVTAVRLRTHADRLRFQPGKPGIVTLADPFQPTSLVFGLDMHLFVVPRRAGAVGLLRHLVQFLGQAGDLGFG